MSEITLGIAFIGGFLSFFSPCIVPLIPAFLSYISGTSIDELKLRKKKSQNLQRKVFFNGVSFVVGFSLIFILLGSALGFLGQTIPGFSIWLGRIGGIIIIVFGLYTLKLINIDFLSRQRSIKTNVKKGYLGSGIIGMSFGLGWSPCLSPLLALILTLAGTAGSFAEGTALLAVYSIGLAIPFLIIAGFTSQVSDWISKANTKFGIINIITGIMLIILGILVFTGNFQQLINILLPASSVI